MIVCNIIQKFHCYKDYLCLQEYRDPSIYFPLDCSDIGFLSRLIGVPSQFAISFGLTLALIIQSILWWRGVRDRAFIITCAPIVSFDIFA